MGFHNGNKVLNSEREVTLPMILRNLGYETAAFVSILPLQRKLCGLDLGLGLYDDGLTELEPNKPHKLRRRANETTAAGLQWISAHKENPFFLWVHYAEPHGPYTPPPPYDTEFVGNALYGRPSILTVGDFKEASIPTYQVLRGHMSPEGQLLDYERDSRYYGSQYDGNLRFVDEHLKVFMQKLHDWQLYDDGLLVITADHGEAFGENNIYLHHGLTVSLEQIRVPLLIKAPSSVGFNAKVIDEPVTHLDIMPTVLGFCGVQRQDLGLQGLNLSPFLGDGAPWPERYIFSEMPSQLSVINEHFQLLYGKGKEAAQRHPYYPYMPVPDGTRLFDYTSDPTGQRDISADHPDIARKLLTVAEQYLRMPVPLYEEGGKDELSEEEKTDLKQRLRQLGYLPASEQEELAGREAIAQLQKVYSSVSWRLTAPLRKLGGLLLGATRLLSEKRFDRRSTELREKDKN
jgi:arylsulfatase